jgi:glutathione synthase/RimK-type ligase-like ATP-grasp enzyme
MKNIAIIGRDANKTNVDLVRRWRALGLDARLLAPSEARRVLRPGDIGVARLDVLPTLDGIEEGLLELLELAADGVRIVNNARSLVNAHDKLRTGRCLAAAGVPHVPTLHVRAREEVTLPPPIVFKPRFGSWGIDVMRCDDVGSIDAVFATIERRRWFGRHGAIVQPLMPPMGRDLRILVANGEMVGAEGGRVAARGEWRTNISVGGGHLAIVPGSDAIELAVAAAAATGGEFVGVDLTPTFGGHVVLEVNAAVEFDVNYASDGDVFAYAAAALGFVAPPIEVPLAAGLR